MADPPGQLSPDGRWRWDGREWVATNFAGLEPRINPLAIAAFTSSMLIPLWPVSSVAAVVLGLTSMRQLRGRPTERGRGLALAGVTIGLVVVLASVVVLGVVLAVAAPGRA